MIGRPMAFLGLGLLATIVPPNEPKCVLGIILSRPSGVERPPEGGSIDPLGAGQRLSLVGFRVAVHPHSYPPAAGVDHPRRHPPLFSITVFCELPSAHPARFYLFSPIYSLMIGRLMTFLGRGLVQTIVPPNKPKCVLGIILSDLLELSARP